jgi:hypothetical protein
MNYDVEVVIEHRYIVHNVGGRNQVEAANSAIGFAMDNEKSLELIETDGRVENVTFFETE